MNTDNGAKVKIQDIADKVGLSRNTVSKIFNGKYRGPKEINDKVLALAVEMKYKQYGQLEKIKTKSVKEESLSMFPNKNILVLSKGDVINSNFFAHVVNEIQKKLEGEGYNLLLVNVTEQDIANKTIPSNVNKDVIGGMICMELFDKEYIESILSKGIPSVFIEFYYKPWDIRGKYDVIMMNNTYHLYSCVESLIKNGCKRIGYVGDYTHCLGFYERYKAYMDALRDNLITIDKRESLTMNDGDEYFDVDCLADKMKTEMIIPDAYICANDAIAINIIAALKKIGFNVPEDVQIVSFDDIIDAALVKPSLTTVRIFREDLGRAAIDCLLERMSYPEKKQQIVYIETELIKRESTKRWM